MQTISRKTLLYKSNVEYADYCVNHIEGCSHGCRFPCYAMMMKKRCGVIKDYNDWVKPKIVSNALELLDKEIPKLKGRIKSVHLCFTSDPFMYKYPEVSILSLEIIKKLNENGIKCTVLTKGVYPQNLINKKIYSSDNEYAITLVSLNKKFKEQFEPGAASYDLRIKNLKYLHDNGLKTWISMEPYPTPNLVKQDLLEILEQVKFVDKIVFGKLNYNVKVIEFEDNKDFYNNCAETVIYFCNKNKIKYHIKYGTQKENSKKTEEPFVKNISENLNLEYTKQLVLSL